MRMFASKPGDLPKEEGPELQGLVSLNKRTTQGRVRPERGGQMALLLFLLSMTPGREMHLAVRIPGL